MVNSVSSPLMAHEPVVSAEMYRYLVELPG